MLRPGGTATIIGTPPNVILIGQMSSLLSDDSSINFVEWLLFAFPFAISLLFFVWLYLAFIVCRLPSDAALQDNVIEKERQALDLNCYPTLCIEL